MDLKRSKSISQFNENSKQLAFEKPIPAAHVLKNPVRLLPQTRKRKEYEEYGYSSSKEYSELERTKYLLYSDTESGSGRCCDATLASLSELQKFRLSNANDCFSKHRQLDLKMDRILTDGKSYNYGAGAEFSKTQETPLTKQSIVMPYAMRQRMLRLQLESEAAPSLPERRRKMQQGI